MLYFRICFFRNKPDFPTSGLQWSKDIAWFNKVRIYIKPYQRKSNFEPSPYLWTIPKKNLLSFLYCIVSVTTVCFLKTVPSATCVLKDIWILFIKECTLKESIFSLISSSYKIFAVKKMVECEDGNWIIISSLLITFLLVKYATSWPMKKENKQNKNE